MSQFAEDLTDRSQLEVASPHLISSIFRLAFGNRKSTKTRQDCGLFRRHVIHPPAGQQTYIIHSLHTILSVR
jgi:hypothetical protein